MAVGLLIRPFLYLVEDTLVEIRVVYTKDLAEWIQETQNILFKQQVSWQNNHIYNNISIIQMNRAHVGNSKQNVHSTSKCKRSLILGIVIYYLILLNGKAILTAEITVKIKLVNMPPNE